MHTHNGTGAEDSVLSMHVYTCMWCGVQSTRAYDRTVVHSRTASTCFFAFYYMGHFQMQLPTCRTIKSRGFLPSHQSSLPNLSDFFKVVKMTAHEERRGSHDEVQHLTRQDGHEGVLPLQGVEVGHEALSHERQQGPV